MYLGIRTDSPLAEFYLYVDGVKHSEKTWQADRQLAKGLLSELEVFLSDQNITLQDVKGLFAYEGPGSFTGLRIGLTVMNTASYALSVPIVGSRGENWQSEAVERLMSGMNDEVVLPFYGAEARITKPKK